MEFLRLCRGVFAWLRRGGRASAVALLFTVWHTEAVSMPPTPIITLEQAWQLAEQANPALRAAEATFATAEGELRDARALLWNNPELSTGWRSRNVPQTGNPAQAQREWTAGIAQRFEIAGQQGARRTATERALAATRELVADTRRQVRAEVEQRFVRVLSLQLRIETEGQTLKLIEEAAGAVRKRVAAGEDSRLDGNLASVEAERARNQLASLREQLVQSRAELAAALQLPDQALPEVSGALDVKAAAYGLDDLLASTDERPLLRALDHQEEAARARLALERAVRYPDITVGLNTGREGSADLRERVAGVSVTLPLPLFRRNGGGIGRAVTDLTQAEIEKQAGRRDTRTQVLALWERLRNLRERVARLQGSVLPGLEENQRLVTSSFRAGEIGLLQLLLVNRQVLEGRRDLLEARTELRRVSVALEAAAGWHQADSSR